MYEENHAEIKDLCNDLETKLDEVGVDLKDIPFDYKLINHYGQIDQELGNIHDWYDKKKKTLVKFGHWYSKYLQEREQIYNKLNNLTSELKGINNSVQNIKLQEFSRVQLEQ